MTDCPDTTMYCARCNGTMAIEHDREFVCACWYRVPVVTDEFWNKHLDKK